MPQFKSLDANDLAALQAICPGRVWSGEAISPDFAHDELAGIHRLPEALVEPLSTEEVSAVLRHAWEHNLPVTPRGQGTGLVGGAVALQGGILLNLSRMNRILELDPQNLTLTVEPGVLIMDIYPYVEAQGLYYPPNPGEKSATIGGNVSTNAGGMSAVKYGVTRDYVRGLEIVLPDGSILELGGKVVKNSSGYSLLNLIIGSEGTLAVVTKIILRLLPLPPLTSSLLAPFPDLKTAARAVPELLRLKATPRSIEFMERDVILAAEEYLGKKLPDASAEAYLLLLFDGTTNEEIERAFDAAAQICLQSGALDVLLANTEERQESIWSPRGAFLEAIKSSTSEMDECDVVVPRTAIPDFIEFVGETAAQTGLRMKSFGHAGDGNCHIYLLRDALSQEEWEQRRTAAFEQLYARARQLGGKVSGEHGIGYAKQPYLAAAEGPVILNLMRQIKQTFDPKGILNPGKVVG